MDLPSSFSWCLTHTALQMVLEWRARELKGVEADWMVDFSLLQHCLLIFFYFFFLTNVIRCLPCRGPGPTRSAALPQQAGEWSLSWIDHKMSSVGFSAVVPNLFFTFWDTYSFLQKEKKKSWSLQIISWCFCFPVLLIYASNNLITNYLPCPLIKC